MKVYFIRHGQTNLNLINVHQGWGDAHLTELGKEQARQTRDLIADIKFDRVYSSDLLRAKESTAIIFEGREDVIFDERLREVNNSCFMGIPYAEMREKYGEAYVSATKNYDYTDFGGENCEHLRERIAEFLRDLETLAKENKKIRRVAVLTHGGIISTVNAIVHGVKINSRTVVVDNASVSVLRYAEERWKIHEWNYTGSID